MIVNLPMVVLIDSPIIKFTCQHHVSAMLIVYGICFCFLGFFFLLLIEIISFAKLWIIVHFFVFKHEKQTLSYITIFTQNLKVIETTVFFLQFILWEHPFFCLNTENYLGLRG